MGLGCSCFDCGLWAYSLLFHGLRLGVCMGLLERFVCVNCSLLIVFVERFVWFCNGWLIDWLREPVGLIPICQ